MADRDTDRGEHELHRDDRARLLADRGFARRDTAHETLEELPPRLTGGVAHELAAQRIARDRVAAVEGDVGLVGPELVAVVVHVPAAVEVDRRERRETEQPPTDPVVHPPVAEEQPVRGLVHQRRELRLRATHQQERADPRERIVQPDREPDDAERLRVDRDHADRVAHRRDAAQVVAQRRGRAAVGEDALVVGLAQQARVGEHRRSHDVDVTLLRQMSRIRNTTAPESGLLDRPLNARSVIGSLLLGVHPPRLPGARIVEWCSRFGIAEGTARVALSRMVDRGELEADEGVYELAGRVRELQPAQDWSLAPDLRAWDGRWRLGIVDGAARDAPSRRAARRDAAGATR